jgi:hypothetical protein
MLTFDEANHQYFWQGKPVPGVSEILKETGQAKDWSAVDPYYRDRGSAVHKAIELWVKDELDEGSLDPVIIPYLEQFKAWVKKENVAGVILTENPFYSETLRFAGTIDLIANQVIWDVKCSKKLDKSSEFQYTAQGVAYRTLVKENMGLDLPFKVLLLTGEGEAKVIPLHAPYSLWEHIIGIYDIKMARDA